MALLAILGGLLAFGWASFFNAQTAEGGVADWNVHSPPATQGSIVEYQPYPDSPPVATTTYFDYVYGPPSYFAAGLFGRGTTGNASYTDLAESKYADTSKDWVGYLLEEGILKPSVSITKEVPTRVSWNGGAYGYTTPLVEFSGTGGEPDVSGLSEHPGAGSDHWGDNTFYCRDGGLTSSFAPGYGVAYSFRRGNNWGGAYDDPPGITAPFGHLGDYTTLLSSWTPTGVKGRLCIDNWGERGSHGGSGKIAEMSRAQFFVYLARALNGGNDPTDTSAHDGHFTDIDTAADWYPHFLYLQKHPKIDNTMLSNRGYGCGATVRLRTTLLPNNRMDVFRASYLLVNAFGLERNIPDTDNIFNRWANRFAHLYGWWGCIPPQWGHSALLLKSIGLFPYGGTYSSLACPVCHFNSYSKVYLLEMLAETLAFSKVIAASSFDPPSCTISSATFDVGDATARVQITLENPNAEAMTIDSAGYTIERAGSPDNQTGIDALAISGNPATIPGGGQAILYSTAQAMTHEGDYSVSWNIQTSIETSSWSTARDTIQTSGGANCESDLHILPIPPSCVIEAAAFGVLDSDAKAKIVLTNPNGGAVTISAAVYTIERSGSPNNQVGVDALAIAGNPNIIPGGGQAVLYSRPQTVGQDGVYSVSWTITAGLGGQSWSTAAGEIQTSAGSACDSSLKIAWRPFIKVFYGGLANGGQFGGRATYEACGQNFQDALGGDLPVQAYIAGHTLGNSPSDARGSSVEHALQAWGAIAGFYSASQRSSDPIPIKSLTLANDDSSVFGGNWQRKVCLANWWRNAGRLEIETKPSPLEIDLASDLDAGKRHRYELAAGERLEIGASANLADLKATLYVEGDILINQDIVQTPPARWHDSTEIGILAIIVKGNIDIAPNVGRIDALLVAYPSGLDAANKPLDGRIRTCWQAGLTAANHYATCNRQLTVNGALIAEKVLFGRSFGDLGQETAFPATPLTTRAAEVINFLPEYLIGIPELPFFADQIHKTESLAPRASNF